jgi:3-oxoacyl-[acyl-carrier protein] reductase
MQNQDPRPIDFHPTSKHPVKPQRGAIVNVASVSGLTGMGLAAYTPTKHAVIGITRNGARFYGPQGIRCNAICPGMTLTPMLEVSLGETGREGSSESTDNPNIGKISLRRMAFAQEQANVVSFLLSSESSYVNGSNMIVDGGFINLRY